MTRWKRKLAAAVVAAGVTVGGAAVPAGGWPAPIEALLGCLAAVGPADSVAALEAAAYARCSWPAYAMLVGSLAEGSHVRFVPVDPGWAAAERVWWANLSWRDYAAVLATHIEAHHFRVVPR